MHLKLTYSIDAAAPKLDFAETEAAQLPEVDFALVGIAPTDLVYDRAKVSIVDS